MVNSNWYTLSDMTRVAHFPAGKRETGNGYREISRREMTIFPGNFPVLTKIGLKWAKMTKI